MRTLYFGRDAWKNLNFEVIAAKEWLAIMTEGDKAVEEVLKKIAKGEYPKILEQMDEFIKLFAGSKHGIDPSKIKEFLNTIESSVIARINPDSHDIEIVRALCMSEELKNDAVLREKFESIRVK